MDDKNVLIIDDEDLILRTLEQIFRSQGYTPHCSQSGKDGLELMAQHNIRVIFTDLRMPEMGGMEVCRRAKALNPNASVFTISAYVDAFSPDEFKDAGFDGQFRKPFDTDALLEACKRVFAKLEPNGEPDDEPDDEPKDEKRSHPRTILNEKILISVINSEKDKSLVGQTYDCSDCTVSAGGIQLCTDRELEPGTDLQLHLGVVGHSGSFLLEGIVRWSRADDAEATETGTRAGVEFLDTSRDLEDWRNFLKRMMAKHHKPPS